MRRGWSDIEPKIAVGIASGSIATGLVAFAQPTLRAYGIEVPNSVWAGLPAFLALFAGYLTPSVGTTITQPTNDKVMTEQHSGNVVTQITTGPISTVRPPDAPFWVSPPTTEPDSNATQVYGGN